MSKWAEFKQLTVTPETVAVLFNGPISCCVATPEMYEEMLSIEETKCLEGAAIKRRREFAAGRAAARRALGHFGVPPRPIPINTDRTPRWPSGFIGSISHCDSCCIAVVGRRRQLKGLGFDIEVAAPLPTEIVHLICSSNELRHFATLASEHCDWAKLAFSAKEAFYKCYYSVTNVFLDFLDVSICFSQADGDGIGKFSVALINPDKPNLPEEFHLTGRWRISQGFVLVGVTLISPNC